MVVRIEREKGDIYRVKRAAAGPQLAAYHGRHPDG